MADAATASDTKIPLLVELNTVDGAVDHRGRPAVRSNYGTWKSAYFIIGVEMAERISFYGIGDNLISYLTGPLGLPTATAAEGVNAWIGVASLLPLLGAVVADSFLGRYRTIIIASLIYILGLGLLAVSATLPSISPSKCEENRIQDETTCSPPSLQLVVFYLSLYLVAIGQGGHKPCVQAFGADQFDGQDPDESKAKSSFFNWWYFGLCGGPLVALPLLFYIQDNLSWGLGFGIPCLIMAVALLVFLLGSRTYRYSTTKGEEEEDSQFTRIGRVFTAAARNWHAKPQSIDQAQGVFPRQAGSQQFKFLDKALLTRDGKGKPCSVADVEEAKGLLRLFPIWATSMVYAIVFTQPSTFFVKQGATMDRSIGKTFSVPSASLHSFVALFVVIFIPIYDRVLVPVARAVMGNPSGITMLQRIGTGLFLSIASMITAALVERKRLDTALEHGLIDLPSVTVPMSVWWLIPQNALLGIADLFTMVGLQEFFYDQVPNEMRSVGLSLYLSIFGIGSLVSSCLVSFINEATTGHGGHGWFANNLNRAHLDYFYWLLAGLSAAALALFIYFARTYIYNRKVSTV
ncbi:hypothetical protein Dimus_025426 [Dionaea muscipula]